MPSFPLFASTFLSSFISFFLPLLPLTALFLDYEKQVKTEYDIFASVIHSSTAVFSDSVRKAFWYYYS
jgi:hypothetical protein